MNQLQIVVYYENKFEDLGIIKNGLKTKLVSALMNSEENYSSPKELFCLSLAICFYHTSKKYLNIKKKTQNDVKIKVLCEIKKDEKGYYLKINLLCGIKNLSFTETKKVIEVVHQKCIISKLLNEYPHIHLSAVNYDEIK